MARAASSRLKMSDLRGIGRHLTNCLPLSLKKAIYGGSREILSNQCGEAATGPIRRELR